MTQSAAQGGIDSNAPTISLVIPVYNVAAFLPAFLDSLAGQGTALSDCELIFVNDGSTDGSAALVRAWITRVGIGEILDQTNRGLSEARNNGLELATGTWVSFPDPDDVLDPDYLGTVRGFIASSSDQADLVCTHIMILDDQTGRISDTHPLRGKFSQGTRLVDLERSPECIHLSAASGFYRRARIEQLGLRFDASIRPHFEDASFTTLYLSASEVPRLGIVADALYLYRKRSDASSLVQGSWALEEKYTTLLEGGYLALLRRVARERGSVPTWVQNLVLYDLLFYFRTDQAANSATGLAKEAWTDRFHELAEEILGYIDVETIDGFSVMPTSNQLRAALIIGYKHERHVPASIRTESLDADQRLVRIRYFCGGPPPDEELSVDGRPGQPVFAKTRDVTYLNRVLLHERILWVPASAEIRMAANGRRVPLESGAERRAMDAARTPRTFTQRVKSVIRTRFPRAVRTVRRFRQVVASRVSRPTEVPPGPFAGLDPRQDAGIRRAARSRPVRKRYGHAWTFIDRDTEAHDNAEHLYRYVRRHHAEVNAWFVLRRDAADWDRLAAEGFRLVPFGTADHVQLLLNTDHLISSQVDRYIVRPGISPRFGAQAWRFTFLQHGVTKDDLSRWLNAIPIDRLITASSAEHASIVADHTPYVFTDKEVRLTGFPRHDRLLELKRRAERPSLLLVTPTWRRWLLATSVATGNARSVNVPLAASDFGRRWFDLIGSAELKAIADASGLEIAFVPHPNMQAHIGAEDVPPWVSIHRYETSDVQELLARAAVTVSDYSSQAFEAAYVECPVVYYQFDRAEFFSGTHVYRKGSWDYQDDGFGPVALTRDDALEAIRDAVARGGPIEPYLSRMRTAFPYRDGRCCERTFQSIASLTAPATFEEAFHFLSHERPKQDAVVASGGESRPSPGPDSPNGSIPPVSAGQRQGVSTQSASPAAVEELGGER